MSVHPYCHSDVLGPKNEDKNTAQLWRSVETTYICLLAYFIDFDWLLSMWTIKIWNMSEKL